MVIPYMQANKNPKLSRNIISKLSSNKNPKLRRKTIILIKLSQQNYNLNLNQNDRFYLT